MIEKIQIVHRDFKESLESMPIESVGRLTLALFRYANEEDPYEVLNGDQIAVTFFPTLKSHIERQEDFRRSRAENGKKGGGQFGNANAKKTSENDLKRAKTSKNEQKRTPNPNPIPNPNPYIKDIVEILSTLNTEAGTHYGESKETVRLITARLRDGFTVADFKKVISKKVKEWKGTEQAIYIRPSTLFAPSHFEEYLNAPEKGTVKESGTGTRNPFNRYSQRPDSDYDYEKLILN